MAMIDHPGLTPHPMEPPPDPVPYLSRPGGREELLKVLEARERRIRDADENPLRCGYRLPWWEDAERLLATHTELLVLGGNDSAKTWFSCMYGVRQLVNQGYTDWAFMQVSQDSSQNQ